MKDLTAAGRIMNVLHLTLTAAIVLLLSASACVHAAQYQPRRWELRGAVVAVTDTGLGVIERFRARREEAFRQILSTWPGEDAAMFLRLLSRLNDDLESYRPLLARATAADPVPPFPPRGQ